MKLKHYLQSYKISYAKFSKLIAVYDSGVVSKYANGRRTPIPEIQTRIYLATNGAVTPSDFIMQNLAYNSIKSQDIQLLKTQIAQAGIQYKFIAYELGISTSALSQKLDGKISIKPHELKTIFELLKSR
ncbi:XRE family transcriptional regulator [Candidatus Hepatincola sp. Av]